MKTKTFLLLCLFTCNVIQAQVIDITGTWTMFEMAWTKGQDTTKTTENQLKAQGSVTDYFFMPDGKFKLISNMTGSGNMETVEGTWKLEGNKLTYNVNINGNPMDIVWDFEFKTNVINLKRTSPDGSMSVVNSFRRK